MVDLVVAASVVALCMPENSCIMLNEHTYRGHTSMTTKKTSNFWPHPLPLVGHSLNSLPPPLTTSKCFTPPLIHLQVHTFLIRSQFISDLVLDKQKIKKLLELQRKSEETLEIPVLFQSLEFGKYISSTDLTSLG